MKKILTYLFVASFMIQNAYALDTVFDSMDKATEVKLAPAVAKTNSSTTTTKTTTQNVTPRTTSVKEQKYNSMLVNLDDAQVDLRQELSIKTAEYNSALADKQKAIQNCKALKNQVKSIKQEMKNNDKSKKIINKNLETLSK